MVIIPNSQNKRIKKKLKTMKETENVGKCVKSMLDKFNLKQRDSDY